MTKYYRITLLYNHGEPQRVERFRFWSGSIEELTSLMRIGFSADTITVEEYF